MTKKIMSNYCKSMLIMRIGKELYLKLDPETKSIMLLNEIKQFQREMKALYGSLYNYQNAWAKKRGWKNIGEYNKWRETECAGFKSQDEYRDANAKKRGFKSRGELYLFYAKLKGFKTLHEHYCNRYKKRGFSSQAEYRKALAESKGFKNYSQLCKHNKKLQSAGVGK